MTKDHIVANISTSTLPISTYDASKWSLDIKEDAYAIVVKYGVLQINLQYVQ